MSLPLTADLHVLLEVRSQATEAFEFIFVRECQDSSKLPNSKMCTQYVKAESPGAQLLRRRGAPTREISGHTPARGG